MYWDAGRSVFDKLIPEGYLDQWKEVLSIQPQRNPRSTQSFMYFRLGDAWFALSTRYFVEVSPVKPLHQIPHLSRSVMLGLVNIGGAIRLCFSLHHLFEIAPVSSQNRNSSHGVYKRLIVVKISDHDFVFPVDEIGGVYRCAESEISKIAETEAHRTEYLSGMLDIDGKKVACIDTLALANGLEGLAYE